VSSSALWAVSSGAPIRAGTRARRFSAVSYAKLRLGATTLTGSIIFKKFSMWLSSFFLIEYVCATVEESILKRPFSTRSFQPPSPLPTLDVSLTTTLPSHDARTPGESVSHLMYLTNSGNTLWRSRTNTPHHTRPVRMGITDIPPLSSMPSLIALPPRRTPRDRPAAAPTRASAVIEESTRKPP